MGAQLTADLSLALAGTNATIDATSTSVAEVNSTSGEQSTLIDPKQILHLPLNGRNFEQLILLAPGSQPSPASSQSSFYGRSASYSISGTRPARLYAEPASPAIRLYAIDCGRLDYANMDGFSDTDDYAGQKGSIVVPCFLVRHGSEWLLWDIGVGDRIAALTNGE